MMASKLAMAEAPPPPWNSHFTLKLKVTQEESRAIQAWLDGAPQRRLHVNELSVGGLDLKLELVAK